MRLALTWLSATGVSHAADISTGQGRKAWLIEPGGLGMANRARGAGA